jgi:teichuronic acid biosynthesis glycosyltransferase TuaC
MPSLNAARKLHVLTLTSFFPSRENEVGGCFIAEPIELFKQFGIQSSVIAVSPLHRARQHTSPLAPAEWMRYPAVPRNLGLSSAGKLLSVRIEGQVRKMHSTNPIDMIHAHAALPCGQAAAILSRRLNIPFVVSVHGLDAFNTCYVDGTSAAWRHSASVKVYQAASSVMCVSDKIQRIIKSGVSANTTVLYNGVDPELFSPATNVPDTRDPEILIVGNLLRSKGHELVLRAIAKLQSSFPKIRCRIIGEGQEHARLEATARELSIRERVQFDGRRSRPQVADAMRSCSVFVLPSSNEGLGCVYLEAMSCGKPAIGCLGQGIDEVIEHGKNGWLVPVDGFDELVQGLSILLEPSDLVRNISAAARQTIIERLTLAHQARSLAYIYRQGI